MMYVCVFLVVMCVFLVVMGAEFEQTDCKKSQLETERETEKNICRIQERDC